uniref:GH18 domain-containing protein n=1 Tax=Oryza barthii TaxID=65489 RepID=A0A0D3GTW5_9ORYZ
MALTFTRHSLVVIVGALLLQLFFLAGLAPAAAAAGPTGQVTVFWGRNKDEGSLREACDTGLYTMVVMSFLNVYGARGGEYRLDLAGHPVGGIGGDVKHCQRKGVLVSLAIGSGAYSLPTNHRIYFGLPAAPAVAEEEQDGRSGYVYPKTLYYRYVPELQKAANYGGFMIWDRYSDKQSGYSGYVKNWA